MLCVVGERRGLWVGIGIALFTPGFAGFYAIAPLTQRPYLWQLYLVVALVLVVLGVYVVLGAIFGWPLPRGQDVLPREQGLQPNGNSNDPLKAEQKRLAAGFKPKRRDRP
jgi:hypothetical protein